MKSGIYHSLAVKTCGCFLIWLLLSESFILPHVVLGLLVAFTVAWLNTERSAPRPTILRWRSILYLPWLMGKILQSGSHLSMLILHPKLPIDPRLVRHRSGLRQEEAIALLGNSITLTPGTITVEVNAQDLVVHAMDEQSARDVTSLRFDQQIGRLFAEKGTE